MSEKTVRKYRDAGQLPSQMDRPPRTYRTRRDPLEEFWPEVEQQLEANARLKPYASWLKQKHNQPDTEFRVTDTIRRSLERRVRLWKLDHGVEQEVYFPQVHHPGDVFVHMNSLGVTIHGKLFEHMMFHAVFTYSNWEHVRPCQTESFEALSIGLQETLHTAGGVEVHAEFRCKFYIRETASVTARSIESSSFSHVVGKTAPLFRVIDSVGQQGSNLTGKALTKSKCTNRLR